MSDSKPISVQLRDVSKTYAGGVSAVDGVDLAISGGRVTALLGPTGCGKTTLLRMIGGLTPPTGGSILFSRSEPVIGYCFQEPRLLPWRTVERNVGLPLELLAKPIHGQIPYTISEMQRPTPCSYPSQ